MAGELRWLAQDMHRVAHLFEQPQTRACWPSPVCGYDGGSYAWYEPLGLNRRCAKCQRWETKHTAPSPEVRGGYQAARGVSPWREGDPLPEDVIRRSRDDDE